MNDFTKTPRFIKGKLGEDIVDAYLMSRKIMPYRPIGDGAHPFDRLCASQDKRRIFVAEVKTKPRRNCYRDTGFNIASLNDYTRIATEHNMDVFVYFVDEKEKSIYGNELFGVLMKEWTFRDEFGLEQVYPWRQGKIIYFHLDRMVQIASLSDEQCAELSALTRSNFIPPPTIVWD